MTRATAKIMARNPNYAKQMVEAQSAPAKPKRKQPGRSPSSAEKAAPAILDWLEKRDVLHGWICDNNAQPIPEVLTGAVGTDGGAEACTYTPDFTETDDCGDLVSIIEVKHEGHLKKPEARVGRVKFKLFQCIPPYTELRFLWCELKPWGWLVKHWQGGRLERKEKVTFEMLMKEKP